MKFVAIVVVVVMLHCYTEAKSRYNGKTAAKLYVSTQQPH